MPPGTSYFSPAARLLHLLHSFSHPKLCSIRESIQQIDSKRILEKPRYRYICRGAFAPDPGETGRQPSRGFHEASVPTGTEAGAPPIGRRASIAFCVIFDCRDVAGGQMRGATRVIQILAPPSLDRKYSCAKGVQRNRWAPFQSWRSQVEIAKETAHA